jgi:hypothetical protein
VQTNFFPDSVIFSDGTVQLIQPPGIGTSSGVGEIAFVGFTDAGKSITSITILAGDPSFGQDAIGVDDVKFQSPAVVPEPSSLVLCGIAGVAAVCYGQTRRRRTLA